VTTERTRTWVDYATWVVATLVVVLLAYLGYAAWAQRAYNEASSPAARAAANLEAAVRKRPNDAGLRIGFAQALTAAGRTEDAVSQYEAALKLDKDNPVALSGLGLLAMDAQEWVTAEGYWLRIIDKLDKGDYRDKDTRLEAAYYYLGTVQMQEQKYQDAVTSFKAALRIRRDASDTYYAMSLAYSKLGMPDRTFEFLKSALLLDPGMPEANYDMGQILVQRSQIATAAELFRLSIKKAPETHKSKPQRALDALGTAAEHLKRAQEFQKSQPASATVEARVAVAIDPQNVDAARLLAQLYDAHGDTTKALDAYQAVLTLLPGDTTATAAVARLSARGK
jgi:tetratricopeptide (TPR) repeat protein